MVRRAHHEDAHMAKDEITAAPQQLRDIKVRQ